MHHPLKLCKAIMSHNALIAHDAAAPVMFVSLLWQMNGTALILNYSIPQDVEANTVRLKEHDHPVLVLEKSPRASTLGNIKYVFGCMHTVPKSTLKLCLQYMCISLYFIKNVWVFMWSLVTLAGTLWYQELQRRFLSTSWRRWGWTYITVTQVAELNHQINLGSYAVRIVNCRILISYSINYELLKSVFY